MKEIINTPIRKLTKTLFVALFLLLALRNNPVKASAIQLDSTNNYSIRGRIKNYNNGWVFLAHGDIFTKNTKIDSVKVVNGEFTFNGKISGIEPFLLGRSNKDAKGKLLPSRNFVGPFILSAGNLYIEGEFDNMAQLTVSGTEAQEEFNVFRRSTLPIKKRITKIMEEKYALKKSNSHALDSLDTQQKLVQDENYTIIRNHIQQFPNSYVSAYIAKSNLDNVDPEIIKSIYDILTINTKESKYGNELLYMIQSTESTGLGRIAPVFNLPNTAGQFVSLEASKGTYTLLDFWASWCGPCRMENPNLIKAYNSYQDKGFKIIGISLDNNKSNWLKAIEQDKLTWLQVSDLKGMQSEVKKAYGIRVIPMNFLIDKEGKIIARNLKGNELMSKLKELLDAE